MVKEQGTNKSTVVERSYDGLIVMEEPVW